MHVSQRLALLATLPMLTIAAFAVTPVFKTPCVNTVEVTCPVAQTVQGEAGPAGPTGPRGAQGPAGADAETLPHVLYLPATADPVANGVALSAALASFGFETTTPASAGQPYVIQLDAGSYSLAGPGVLLPYVSLVGAGMFSTTVKGAIAVQNSPINGNPVAVDARQTISNLTLAARTGAPALTAQLADVLILDHVQIINTTATTPSVMTVNASGARFLIMDSLIGNLSMQESLPYHNYQTAVVTFITGSEVDLVQMTVPPPAILLCQANYNAAGVALAANCLPPVKTQ